MGDFNIDLLPYENDNQTIFLDYMYSSSLYPQVTIPKRITLHYKTLIDNITSNSANETSINKLLDKFKSFYKNKFGFRNLHSSNHTLARITE